MLQVCQIKQHIRNVEQQPEVGSLIYRQSVMLWVQDCQSVCQDCIPTQIATPSMYLLGREAKILGVLTERGKVRGSILNSRN